MNPRQPQEPVYDPETQEWRVNGNGYGNYVDAREAYQESLYAWECAMEGIEDERWEARMESKHD
jgi:hypothetical protein